MKYNISIFGFGGHAKVLIDSAKLCGYKIDSIFDDDEKKRNLIFDSKKIVIPIDEKFIGHSIVAIGDNKCRKSICDKIFKARWVTLIHPSAVIASDVLIGEGTVIMAGAIIQSGSIIGKHCIINSGACIDHDCLIADYVHIAPKCGLAGGVSVGEGTFIGIGSSIIPNRSIGKWTNIGAGSVVITNQPDYCTSVGIPAKPIKFYNEQE